MYFELGVKQYDLAKTLRSGQMFRYKELSDNSFQVMSGDKMVVLTQRGTLLTAQSFTSEDDSRYWKHYLNLGFDADSFEARMRENPFLSEVFDFNRGLYLLRQDPWECLICFIISQRKRIDQIRICVDKLCETVGERVGGRHGYFKFPTPEQILRSSLENVPLGYRRDYVWAAAKACRDGWINLQELKAGKCDFLVASEALCNIYGVGLKVANCVLLFGLDHTEAFPIDVHIQRVLDLPEMRGFNYKDYGKDAGVVQQYLFNYAIHHGI